MWKLVCRRGENSPQQVSTKGEEKILQQFILYIIRLLHLKKWFPCFAECVSLRVISEKQAVEVEDESFLPKRVQCSCIDRKHQNRSLVTAASHHWLGLDRNLMSLWRDLTQGKFTFRLLVWIQILQMRISCLLVPWDVIYFHPYFYNRVMCRLMKNMTLHSTVNQLKGIFS